MDVFPFGFLPEFYILTALDEIESQSDYSDCEPGELLVPPAMLDALTAGEITGATAFLGCDSLSGTSLGNIQRRAGGEVLAAMQRLAEVFGAGDEALAACLQMLLDHSAQIEAIAHTGSTAVRVNACNTADLVPAGELSPEISRERR